MSDIDPTAPGVTGTDSAGIYGDPAGAAQHAPAQSPEQTAADLAAAGAEAHSVDAEALLRRIQALEAERDAAAAANAPAPPVPYNLGQVVLGQAPSIVHAFELVEERLAALENPGGDAEA